MWLSGQGGGPEIDGLEFDSRHRLCVEALGKLSIHSVSGHLTVKGTWSIDNDTVENSI